MKTETTETPTGNVESSPIGIGSRIKFIQRNAFFEGTVMDVDRFVPPEPQTIPIHGIGGRLAARAIIQHELSPEPILYVAVIGYKTQFSVWIGDAVLMS